MSESADVPERNVALRISYDGSRFLGWQRQSEAAHGKGRTVQEEIERKVAGDMSDASYEVKLRTKDDSFIPFEVNMRVRSEGRERPDIIGVAREISERKKNEDALRESEERFRTLLQCVPSVAV
ncbi:MAG TPA: PAS domain S-box protein, partial [Treponemataceae bacterium]|nr:PAS domain S-box protein [Treponemataceae bacterium]